MTADTLILTRKATPWPERQTVHVPESRWRSCRLADLLAAAASTHVRTLALIAGPYADQRPDRDWMLAPAAAGWDIANYLGDPPRATYRQAGHAVDVVTTAPWFGECVDKPAIDQAWHVLRGLVRGQFDSGATLMSTPAGTGLDLLRRSLPREASYPVAPPDLLALMHANGGQGRMEFLPTTTDTSDLYWLDARWQYAVSVLNLPRGQMRYERSHDAIQHVPAFYFVRWKAPPDWPHAFGLLPALTGEEDGPRFHYPIDRQWHTGWITGVELELAREEGWDVRVSERLWWDMTTPDPTRTWGTKLRTLREHTRDPLAQAAIRHILIDGIGAWFRQGRRELHITPRAQAETLPEDAYGIKLIDDVIEWFRDGQLPATLRDMQHPEWSWTVWGRSRVRLLRAGLRYLRTVPGGEIVAWRSDAFVATRDPRWPDDGHVGTFRLKRHLADVAVPHDETAYRALLAGAEEDE